MSYQKGPGQTVVIALGGNALGNTPQEQLELVKNTASHIVDMVGEGVNVVVSHGNGPQVGMIQNAFDYANAHDGKTPAMPLPECGAMSQGYIGYQLSQAILNELKRRDIMRSSVALVGLKVADLAGVDRYRPDSFVLEGGSIHVDGEGTVMTTEMCLLSEGRNPELSKEQIENYLCEYLGVDKVIWIKDGIDPEETNGHIDDVACFVRPGEVACIWTDDEDNPFYEAAHAAYETLSNATDAKGRALKVHKLTMPKEPVYMTQEEVDAIDVVEGTIPRTTEDVCIASYMNFLIGNDFVLVPQYDDEYDEMALQQVQQMFPEREVVGVPTREVVYGGGNIHCITQQQPAGV